MFVKQLQSRMRARYPNFGGFSVRVRDKDERKAYRSREFMVPTVVLHQTRGGWIEASDANRTFCSDHCVDDFELCSVAWVNLCQGPCILCVQYILNTQYTWYIVCSSLKVRVWSCGHNALMVVGGYHTIV
ncbi:hypothetical protein GJ496_005697 [Pomphorhynchus laevis]|nr:hypothetical protein GJ496_005697 [Pomphorhynchus laevis]